MSCKISSIKLLAGIISVLGLVNTTGAFSGSGSGIESDPYIITTVNQLQEMQNDLDAWYELGNDIDASDTKNWNEGGGFIPVGVITPFTGNFNGKGNNVTELFICPVHGNNDYFNAGLEWH